MHEATVTLSSDVTTLQHMVGELLATIAALRSDNQQLQARLDWLVRQHFGRRTERLNPDQLSLFEEPAAEPEPEVVPPPANEQAAAKRPGHGRKPASKGLPRQPQPIDVTEAEKVCPCC